MADDTLRYLPDGLSDELLAADERELLRALGGPTLVRVPGSGQSAPRAVSTLLHGDEPTGFRALLRVLQDRPQLPYDLYAFVGNVRAALASPGYATRYLDDQEDLNRVWGPSAEADGDTPLRALAAEVLDRLRAAGLASLVDLHNTSGDNPYYAIVTRVQPGNVNLATLFTTRVVHWELSNGALVEALQDECVTAAVEFGIPGRPGSLDLAVDGLRRYLAADDLGEDDYDGEVARDHDLMAGLHRVVVPPEVRLRFGGELGDDLDLVVPADADQHNFVEVPAGHILGHVRPSSREWPVEVIAPDGTAATERLLRIDGDRLVLRQAATPVMMTRTVEAVRKDCLVYLAVDSI